MLDEIARLLDQLKSVGDNIAHDLRTPLAVARAKIERSLDNEVGIEQLRETMEAALVQIEKAVNGDLRYFADFCRGAQRSAKRSSRNSTSARSATRCSTSTNRSLNRNPSQ